MKWHIIEWKFESNSYSVVYEKIFDEKAQVECCLVERKRIALGEINFYCWKIYQK